ncbi:MAG: TIGR01777 family protein [Acidobacteria bacterium]|jgi:hypothetical protein|nr:TIGR01777 family protein [Candidatus Sulfomarinibacter sp. MAG AM1]
MKIILSGAGGLIGSTLMPSLEAEGHQVVRLVRPPQEAGPSEEIWDPPSGRLDPAVVDGADAVINLNGRNISDGRWSAAVKNELRTSRLEATRTIVEAIARAETPPRALLNASAVGVYGDRDDEILDEGSSQGDGFLAELSRDWEAAALAAGSDRTRVVLLRLGMVVARGGALGRMLTPFKMGLGGPVGSGRQFWPWIGSEDVCGATEFVLEHDDIEGPVNLVSPQELRCSEFVRTLGRVLHRPAFMPMPAFAARFALGEMAEALLLASARVRPKVLENAGYEYRAPSLDKAIRAALDETL